MIKDQEALARWIKIREAKRAAKIAGERWEARRAQMGRAGANLDWIDMADHRPGIIFGQAKIRQAQGI